jgi:hypothetical protein
LQVYGAKDVENLLKLFTQRENRLGHLDRSRAAYAVLEVAERGDAAAGEILDRHARLLADYAVLVARKVGLVEAGCEETAQNPSRLETTAVRSTVRIVLGGAVLASDHTGLRDRLVADLSSRLPHAEIGLGSGTPVVGALLDALAEGGAALSPTVRDRVLSMTQHIP